MDSLNKKVIKILKEDSRITPDKIADMLGEDEKKIKIAIADMEKNGVIVKYSVVINDDKIDEDRVSALIEVKVSPMQAKGFDSIAEDIYQFKEVKSVYLMSGAYDLAVFVEGHTLKEVANFVSEKLSAMDKIISTATHFILKKYKVEGVVLEKKGNSQRLVFHA